MSATLIVVRVTPRSDRDAVVGVDDSGALRVRVTAAPVDGAANEAVIRVVAKGLGVAKSAITIKSRAGSRIKRLRIDGVNQYDIRARWPAIALEWRARGSQLGWLGPGPGYTSRPRAIGSVG